ncbi:MAG: HU family DNA-binding protein [Spirochaetales bacterium]|nr:HU family DNA-binding protein [Spirochaetales bacterium]
MQKKDMIKDLAVKYNISQAESKRIFDAIFDQLSEVLSQGDYFTEAGFGTFTVAHVKKRKGYNPAIQKFMMLPPKLKPKFKSSDILKSKVNGWNDDTVIADDELDDDEDNNEISTGSPAISTEAEKSTESSAALESSATLGMTNTAEKTSSSAFGESVKPTSDQPETEMVTAEEQSALMSDENEEAANV